MADDDGSTPTGKARRRSRRATLPRSPARARTAATTATTPTTATDDTDDTDDDTDDTDDTDDGDDDTDGDVVTEYQYDDGSFEYYTRVTNTYEQEYAQQFRLSSGGTVAHVTACFIIDPDEDSSSDLHLSVHFYRDTAGIPGDRISSYDATGTIPERGVGRCIVVDRGDITTQELAEGATWIGIRWPGSSHGRWPSRARMGEDAGPGSRAGTVYTYRRSSTDEWRTWRFIPEDDELKAFAIRVGVRHGEGSSSDDGDGDGDDAPWHSVHLTWRGDTSTTMTGNLVVAVDDSRETLPRSASVEWRPSGTDGEKASIEGEPASIPRVPGVRVFRFDWSGLEPGASYDFQTIVDGQPLGAMRKFRTLRSDGGLRLASGGDMDVEPLSIMLMVQAARQSPDLFAFGGDLAYANGLPSNWRYWRRWLDNVSRALVTPSGHTIPLVVAIGNHEVNVGRTGGVSSSAPAIQQAPFYLTLFAQNQGGANSPARNGGPTFFRRGLGPVGAIYVLDSGHVVPHEDQAAWLEERLREDAGLPNRIALYHVPLYPAHRSFQTDLSAAGRSAWEGVFDQGRLTVGLENHDHVFKRTHPIRLGQRVQAGEGVLYLGDGSMGVDPRSVDAGRWYLARVQSEPHFWLADLSLAGATYRAFDRHGRVFDTVSTGGVVASSSNASVDRPLPDRTAIAPASPVPFKPFLVQEKGRTSGRGLAVEQPSATDRPSRAAA